MKTRLKAFLFLFVGLFVSISAVCEAGPSWSEWERKNSVAKEGQYLVIRQPGEGFCYIKQSYDGDPNRMEMSMKKDQKPFLITPFFRGIQGRVSYWVDDGKKRTAKPDRTLIKLSKDIVPELKAGTYLYVRVKPVGKPTMEQKFSLIGFTAASKWLGSDACCKK